MRRTTNSLDREHTAPLQAWAQVRLGSLHLANCDAPSARDCYERALKILPGCFVAGEKLAEWHAANSRWNEARRGFEQLLEQRPEPACRLGLAEAARQLGDNPSARREEQKVIRELRERARRGQEDQLRPLALLLVEEEVGAERAEGLRWARRDAELRQDIFTIDTLAWAHWRNGNTNEAVTLSRKALRAGNRSPLLLLHSGLIHVGTGNAGRGRALLKEATSCPTGFGLHERRLLPAAQAEQSAPPP